VAQNTITNLTGQVRDARGSQAAKHLRQDGRVPAVLYHANDDKTVNSIALDFAEKDIRSLVAHRPTLINVTWGSAEDETRECVLREVQRHPVTQIPMHLDLLGIKRGVKMDSTVALRLEVSLLVLRTRVVFSTRRCTNWRFAVCRGILYTRSLLMFLS